METSIHLEVLASVFVIAIVLGAVVSKTNFCTMGAVSDLVNMGDAGRLRSWLLAIAVAIVGVAVLEASGTVQIGAASFPPYRTPEFAWARYLLGGLLFGVGMTLGSGCGNKTLVRIGGGSVKSLVVLVVASTMAYLMVWTNFYAQAFASWMAPLSLNLARLGAGGQDLGSILAALAGRPEAASGALHVLAAAVVGGGLLALALSSRRFRSNPNQLLGGAVVGLCIVAGWYVTGGPMGQSWREFAEMADTPPSRVQVQSFTFVSPMGDLVHFLMNPSNASLVNFGIVALAGVVCGSLIHALLSRRFRLQWFAGSRDFAEHVLGGVLMGTGGVLSMGCTIGQGVTGFSTLALGSMLTMAAILAGSAATIRLQYRFA